MSFGLSPNTAHPIKSKSIAISAGYLNLSTISSPANTAGIGGPSR